MSIFSLKNKIFILTGCAGDIGFNLSKYLLSQNCKIIGIDKIKNSNLNSLIKYKQFEYINCDLRKLSSLKKILNRLKKKNIRYNGIINNAGITLNKDLMSTEKYFDENIKINLKAPFIIIESMRKNLIEGSSIINITSINAELAFPNNPAYVATKGALKQLTKAYALDLSESKIRCNSIGPGYIKTKMTSKSYNSKSKRELIKNKTMIGRWGKPNDLFGIVHFLLSDASAFITGQSIYVDGGWTSKGL